MSTHSLNRYTPVPPITAKPAQSDKKKKMSSLKSENGQPPQSSVDLCVSGKGKAPNSVKHEASVAAKSTLTGGTEKPDSEAAAAEVNCSQVDGHCNGDATVAATADVVDDALVQSSGEQSIVTTDDKNTSSTVQESDCSAAAAPADDDDDDDDDLDHTEPNTSVSFICRVSQ